MVLFLHPKGNIEAAGAVNLRSRQGWTDWRLSWKIAKLWEIPAEELLAASDVGLIPWVPLTQFDGPPEPIVLQCRARIDQDAPPDEHENLLAVTQLLARLRYHDPKLFQLLGGRKAMIESRHSRAYCVHAFTIRVWSMFCAGHGRLAYKCAIA